MKLLERWVGPTDEIAKGQFDKELKEVFAE